MQSTTLDSGLPWCLSCAIAERLKPDRTWNWGKSFCRYLQWFTHTLCSVSCLGGFSVKQWRKALFNNVDFRALVMIYLIRFLMSHGAWKLRQLLSQPLHNCLSYLGSKIWNILNSDLKSAKTINSFIHKTKDKFFKDLYTQEIRPYIFYQDPKSCNITERSRNNFESAAFLLTFWDKHLFFSSTILLSKTPL